MAASLTGARYLRDAIVADSAQITGSAEFGGSVTVLSGISGDGSKLTGIANPVATNDYISTSCVIARLAHFESLVLTQPYTGLAYSPLLNVIVAVGRNALISTSSDGGLTWINQTSPGGSTDNWMSVVWAESLGKFCVVGYGNRAATSSDGMHWTESTVVWGAAPLYVVWNGAQFLAVGAGFSGMSTDGLNWTVQSWVTATGAPPPWCTILSSTAVAALTPGTGNLVFGPIPTFPFPALSGVAWSPSLGLWVTVVGGQDSLNNVLFGIFTSPDGVNWTQRTQLASTSVTNSYQRFGLVWSPSKGMFLTVSQGFCALSTDGVNWTQPVLANTPGNPNSVPTALEWDGDHGLFICIGDFNVGIELEVSSDGVNWTSISAPTLQVVQTGWGQLVYVSALKRVFAASDLLGSNVSPTIAGCWLSGGSVANLTTSNATGFFGVNTSTPQQALDVGGLARFQHAAFQAVGTETTGVTSSNMSFSNAVSNVGNAYSTGFFTCVANGVHSFAACANIASGAELLINKVGTPNMTVGRVTNTGTGYAYVSTSVTAPFAALDSVSVQCVGVGVCDSASTFSGAMLFAT